MPYYYNENVAMKHMLLYIAMTFMPGYICYEAMKHFAVN